MKHKRLWTSVALVVVGLVLGGGVWYAHQQKVAAAKYVNNKTTTFFFHGWGSSSHAEQHMANAAKRAGATNTIIKANVDKKGKTTITGKITKKSKNPIVEVNFEDNKHEDYAKGGRYVKSAVQAVQKKYGIKKMNLVGHSMGNLDIAFYLLQYANDKSLPTLEHHVAIAGHFDGGIGFGWNKKTTLDKDGKPSTMEKNYKKLLPLRDSYPKTARVLNIAGDLDDGTHSDSEIPVDSAFSLKYLINNRAKSYRQVVIHGKNAQHSKLHSNKNVDKLLINFLWGKDNQ